MREPSVFFKFHRNLADMLRACVHSPVFKLFLAGLACEALACATLRFAPPWLPLGLALFGWALMAAATRVVALDVRRGEE